jgi:hypothetical protein
LKKQELVHIVRNTVFQYDVVYHTQFTGRVVEKDLGEVFTVEELQQWGVQSALVTDTHCIRFGKES